MKEVCNKVRSFQSWPAATLGMLLAGACSAAGVSASAQTTTPRSNDVYAVNAGGGAIDGWTADSKFLLGSTYANTSQTVSLANLPQDDAPSAIYQDEREGDHFSYVFGSLQPNTVYIVTLHFAELYFSSEHQREFNVTMNGTQVLTDFDIVLNAGGPFRAITTPFFVQTNAQGVLEIDFSRGAVDQPVVNAIEVATRVAG